MYILTRHKSIIFWIVRKTGFLILAFLLINTAIKAQSKLYVTGGPEVIFSLAEIDNSGISGGNVMRFAPFFNLQVNGNFDVGKHFGIIFGGAIRNVGLIYNLPDTNIKKKYRNYRFGIPVGIKLGRMNKFLFYGGYEIEFPFQYKEKTFVNNAKQDTKIVDWFTSRTPSYYHSVFVGVQFPYGFSLKFKYYFSEFFNQNFSDANGKPYQGLKANVWYFSLNFAIFQNKHMLYKEYYDEKHPKKVIY